MPSPLFAIPLNMGTGTWVVTIIAGLSFIVMFGLASAGGDYQGLINTTLENDALAREKRKEKGEKCGCMSTITFLSQENLHKTQHVSTSKHCA